jgi:hypothetical protein
MKNQNNEVNIELSGCLQQFSIIYQYPIKPKVHDILNMFDWGEFGRN